MTRAKNDLSKADSGCQAVFDLLKTRTVVGEASHLPHDAPFAPCPAESQEEVAEMPLFLRRASQSLESAEVLRGPAAKGPPSHGGADLFGQGRDF